MTISIDLRYVLFCIFLKVNICSNICLRVDLDSLVSSAFFAVAVIDALDVVFRIADSSHDYFPDID